VGREWITGDPNLSQRIRDVLTYFVVRESDKRELKSFLRSLKIAESKEHSSHGRDFFLMDSSCIVGAAISVTIFFVYSKIALKVRVRITVVSEL